MVATFPADGQVLSGWLSTVRVTFDERVTVLNEDAARGSADGPDGGGFAMRVVADPSDPFSVFLIPVDGGHFVPGVENSCTIQEGAVVTASEHYTLDEERFSSSWDRARTSSSRPRTARCTRSTR